LWQYLEHKKEGRLLRKTVEKGVVNIARYYYYGTVYIGGQDNDIYNIYKGLDITKVINYKLEGLMMPLRLIKVQGSMRRGQNFSRKRFSSCSALLLLGKCLTSLTKCPIKQNRVH
jgi:hypothetical protein